jgi:hypothetical protein
MNETMAMLAGEGWLSLGTVYSQTAAKGHVYGRERERVYLELIRTLDALLADQDDFGIVVMDGDGSEEAYITAHRQLDLATRSLIEDPGFQHSHRSQWIQMVDLVAYATYQHLLRHDGKRFAWSWYPMLQTRDVLGAPRAV